MYAIRSYYVFKVDSENLTVTQIIDKIGSKHRKKISDKRLEMKRSIDRITSYNVCYTKLLRTRFNSKLTT